MKTLPMVSVRGWGKIAVPILIVLGIVVLPLGLQTSFAAGLVSADQPVAADQPSAPISQVAAGQPSVPISQIELLQWHVHLRGAEASLPTAAPAGKTVTRSTPVSVVDKFGFQSWAARAVLFSNSKEKGNNGVGNGIDPAPPGNPKPNDGAGTGPGNPGNNVPIP